MRKYALEKDLPILEDYLLSTDSFDCKHLLKYGLVLF